MQIYHHTVIVMTKFSIIAAEETLNTMDILAVCPRLVALSNNGTLYRGYVTAENQDFFLEISLPSHNDVKNAKINCDWKLQEILRDHVETIQRLLNHSSSLAGFLIDLKSMLRSLLQSRPSCFATAAGLLLPKFYIDLLKDIEILGWHRLSFIDSEFRELHILTTDGRSRLHTLKVLLHHQHPNKAPEYHSDLPLLFDYAWNAKSTLSDLFDHFNKCVDQLQEFWNVVDDIDINTCVLEPEMPTRSATHRRIALGRSASVQIEVDPRNPHQIPDCQFLGSEPLIGPLKENFAQNMSIWNSSRSFVDNLCAVLEFTLPSRRDTKKEDLNVACGICYAYRLDGETPDQVCDNPHCSQPFHCACLCEWLRSLPSSRQSFNVLFGDCPFCSKPITVKIVSR